jgi:regulatory protein YycI of two-component signal transduction system YycFG
MGWFIVELLVPSLFILVFLVLFVMLGFLLYNAIKTHKSSDKGLTNQEQYILKLENELTVANETITRLSNLYVKEISKRG